MAASPFQCHTHTEHRYREDTSDYKLNDYFNQLSPTNMKPKKNYNGKRTGDT